VAISVPIGSDPTIAFERVMCSIWLIDALNWRVRSTRASLRHLELAFRIRLKIPTQNQHGR
jgi:hypothetical protein